MVVVIAGGLLTVPFRPASPAAGALPAPQCDTMQVVAHEDDDLLFMNPDIDRTAAAGRCQVTVFITAGNGQPTVRHRQRGIQDAYRIIGGVADQPYQDEWDRDLVTFNARQVEVFTLRANTNVRLLFMNLPDPTRSVVPQQPSLSQLWQQGNLVATTSVPCVGEPAGYTDERCLSPSVEPFRYTKDDLIQTLASIMVYYHPHTIRLQDNQPDIRYTPIDRSAPGFYDHPDHVAAADFTEVASRASGTTANLVYYRDYNIRRVAPNLATTVRATKTAQFNKQYARLNRGAVAAYTTDWLQAMYYRWPRGNGWVASNADNRLQAFDVRDGQVFTTGETSPGLWHAEASLGTPPSGGVFPAVSAVKNLDGRMEIFALGYDYHVVAKVQTSANGGWSSTWDDLGSPDLGNSVRDQVGVPVAVNNQDGRIQLFMKNGGGGISSIWQTNATSLLFNSGWADFGGSWIQDPVTAINAGGLIHVFASTSAFGGGTVSGSVLAWHQTQPNGVLGVDDQFLTLPASAPAAGVDADGRVEIHFRQPGTGGTFNVEAQNSAGGWTAAIGNIGGQGGVGQSSLYTPPPPSADRRIIAVSRNTGGGVSLAIQNSQNGPYNAWQDLGGIIVDTPVVSRDSGNRIVVLAVGLDGHFWLRRQSQSSLNSAFDAWTQIG